MVILYKHKNNTDVAFEIIKSFYIKEKKEYSLKIAWWNVVHEPVPMNITQRIKIPKKALKDDWEVLKYD